MKREIKRLEIKEGVHLEGIGIVSSVLPMRMKEIQMKMYYDNLFPTMVMIECKNKAHFISMDNVKSGTFIDEVVNEK